MSQSPTIEILKEAMLLEQRGRAFYFKAAQQASDKEVRSLFELMAGEEANHLRVLSEQYKSYRKYKTFTPPAPELTDARPLADLVLSKQVKEQIAAAGFEAAAISAAIALEERAVSLYSGRAAQAQDPNEQILFQWLADWERGHLAFLMELDREIKARIWNDNQYWPF